MKPAVVNTSHALVRLALVVSASLGRKYVLSLIIITDDTYKNTTPVAEVGDDYVVTRTGTKYLVTGIRERIAREGLSFHLADGSVYPPGSTPPSVPDVSL